MESFRKAYGALKDSTKVGLAKVNSEFKELDIAIVKATNHVERPPKERHVRKIFAAVAISCPRADVGYCIHALSKRLSKTHSWIVAIKCLIVFHRILREGDPSFREELAHFSRRGNLFQISNFKDDSGPVAWDCSAWVRTYALFLEERLQCLRNLNYDTESDKGPKSASGESKAQSKPPLVMNAEELLEQLPELQQLLYRLVCCQPEGAARHNFVVQYALALVVKESFKVYCAINDGIINLVDTFFEMPKHDAVRALDIYKKAGRQADHLADFYGFCRTLELAQTFQFPTLRQPPPSFLATMEEYIKEASQAGPSGSQKRLALPGTKEEPKKPEEPAPEESKRQAKEVEHKKKIVHEEPVSKIRQESISRINQVNPPLISAEEPVDLLGLDEINPRASQIEENNALALAIVQPGNEALPTNNALNEIGKVSGWELALVTTPSNTNNPQVAETKMAGGFNKSLLDSLYDDDFSRRQLQLHSAGYSTGYGNGYNDPFAMTNNVGPAHTDVHHMGMMSQQQQQQQMTMHQQHMVMHHHHHHHHQQHHQPQQYNMMMMMAAPHTHNPYAASSSSSQYTTQQQIMPQMGGSFNPFGDPFGYPQATAMPPHGNHTLL
ncbi:hypothetical protein ACP275_12G163500 [Erythranthe tilingii]